MGYAKVLVGLEALVVLLVVFLGSVFRDHADTKKNRMFTYTCMFFMLADFSDLIWSIFGNLVHNEFLAKFMVTGALFMGTIAEALLGFFLIALVEERNFKIPDHGKLLVILTAVTLLYEIVGTSLNVVFLYANGKIYYGEHFDLALHMIVVVGLYEIILIIRYSKYLGKRGTIITLAYFFLPVIATAAMIIDSGYNFIFAAIAISLLFVNNLLMSKETSDANLKKELAESAEKNKSEFLANMSHEIRTPINAVLGFNELIIRETKDNNILDYSYDIKTAGNQLLSLVNNVLDYSKIESGKMELVPVTFEISSLINDIANAVSEKIEQKGLEFVIDVDSATPRLLVGDEIRLKQICVNLLNIAIKYTKKGFIKFEILHEKIDDNKIGIRFFVEDTGSGLRDEDVDKLFVPFDKIDKDGNIDIEDGGLVLTVSKYFLKLMGSELKAASVYGKGTICYFTLEMEVKDWTPMGDFKEAYAQIRDKEDKYKASIKAPSAKILIVDDMPMNLTVARGLLRNTMVQIETATSGAEAVELCTLNRYDIVYLDHMMPGMDGVTTLKKMKEDPEGINFETPVIALTANAVAGAKEEYESHGFKDYITKPIDPMIFEKSLANFLPAEKIIY